MTGRSLASRRFAAAAAVVLTLAVAIRLLTLPLSTPVLAVEAVVCAVVLGFIVASYRLSRLWARNGALLVLYALTPALVASLGLRLAAPELPDYTMVAALVFAGILLSIDVNAPRLPVLLASGAVLIVFAEVWFDTVSVDLVETGSLLFALAVLAATQLLVISHTARSREAMTQDALRGRVFASLARRMGILSDIPSVVTAVLEVCREAFPQTSYGAVLVRDDSDGMLRSPGVVLGPRGIVTGGAQAELAPGEGLGGAVFANAHSALWPTALEVSTAHRNLREPTRERMRELRAGFVRSAIAAPLKVGRGDVIGSIVLLCHGQEHAWSNNDLALMQAIADEAARDIERARRHKADIDHALLDPVTELVTRAQFEHILEKEVARSLRGGDTLAVIFADIDGFKTINEAWGHEAGDEVLRTYADVLRATLRREDTPARFGPDEFVCVLPGADGDQAAAIANRVAARFRDATRRGQVSGGEGASVSVGYAVYPVDADSAFAVLTAAQAATLRNKLDASVKHELTGRAHVWSREEAEHTDRP